MIVLAQILLILATANDYLSCYKGSSPVYVGGIKFNNLKISDVRAIYPGVENGSHQLYPGVSDSKRFLVPHTDASGLDILYIDEEAPLPEAGTVEDLTYFYDEQPSTEQAILKSLRDRYGQPCAINVSSSPTKDPAISFAGGDGVTILVGERDKYGSGIFSVSISRFDQTAIERARVAATAEGAKKRERNKGAPF